MLYCFKNNYEFYGIPNAFITELSISSQQKMLKSTTQTKQHKYFHSILHPVIDIGEVYPVTSYYTLKFSFQINVLGPNSPTDYGNLTIMVSSCLTFFFSVLSYLCGNKQPKSIENFHNLFLCMN
jgi:hypothetical protein